MAVTDPMTGNPTHRFVERVSDEDRLRAWFDETATTYPPLPHPEPPAGLIRRSGMLAELTPEMALNAYPIDLGRYELVVRCACGRRGVLPLPALANERSGRIRDVLDRLVCRGHHATRQAGCGRAGRPAAALLTTNAAQIEGRVSGMPLASAPWHLDLF